MNEPRIVLTGASSGLGRLAAIRLASGGARLVLVGRDPARMAETVSLIRTTSPEAQIEVRLADLSSIAQTVELGRALAATHPAIDVLVANAGIHAFTPRATAEGFPEMIAVNYLSPWVLAQELLPSLMKPERARVVVVASEASKNHGAIELPDDLTEVTRFSRAGSSVHYGRSKLFDIMFARALARRLAGSGVATVALDPGFNVTGLGRELPGAALLRRVLTAAHIGDPERGAGLIVRAAVDPAFADRDGDYWTARGPRRIDPTPSAEDRELQEQLWAETARVVAPWLSRA